MSKQQIQAIDKKQADTTLIIQALEQGKVLNGFRVIVGLKKGSGSFNYVVGSRAKAQEVGEYMKEMGKMMFKRQKGRKIYVVLEPCKLQKCKYCDNVCEDNERLCIKCEDMMYDAMCDAKSMSRAERLECEGCCDE